MNRKGSTTIKEGKEERGGRKKRSVITDNRPERMAREIKSSKTKGRGTNTVNWSRSGKEKQQGKRKDELKARGKKKTKKKGEKPSKTAYTRWNVHSLLVYVLARGGNARKPLPNQEEPMEHERRRWRIQEECGM